MRCAEGGGPECNTCDLCDSIAVFDWPGAWAVRTAKDMKVDLYFMIRTGLT